MTEPLVLEAIQGGETERVPVAPLVTLPHASRLYGIRAYEYIFDSEKYALAQIHARKRYGYDWVFAHQIFLGLSEKERKGIRDMGDHFLLTLELGTTFKIPKDGAPFIVQRAVKRKEDAGALELPDMFDPDRLRALKIMRSGEDFVCGNIRCPFTFAGTYLFETEEFYMDVKRDKGFVRELLELALRYCLESAEAQIEAGVDAMFIEDPSASPNVISPGSFRELALPYERRLVKAVRKHVPVVLHVCGDTGAIIKDMLSTGADCISLDECMDMRDVHRSRPVWGNISPSQLVKESPERIREVAEEIVALEQGVVLSSGCVVPAIARPENIDEMVRAAHEH